MNLWYNLKHILSLINKTNNINEKKSLITDLNSIVRSDIIIGIHNSHMTVAAPIGKLARLTPIAILYEASIACEYDSEFILKVIEDREFNRLKSIYHNARLEDMFPEAIDKINILKMNEALE